MNKLWKAAGILGGVLVVTAGSGTLVLADETSTEVTEDNSGSSVLDTDEWAQKAAANVTDYANIRQEGSQESERVGVLPKGAAAQVVEQEGDWTKITSGSVEGYVRSDLLVFGEEAKNLYEESYGSQGTVTASSLRVRKQGSRVEILGQEGDWYQVSYGEDSAYMFAEYIQIEETTALSVAEYEAQQKEKEQVSQTGTAMSASDSELALLAAIIQCEAGGESNTGKVAVGAVIMNRVRSSQFPNSITEVVYQSGQFSPVASGILSSVLSQGARSDCYQAAQEALAGSNPIGSALYFNSGSGRGQQIGNQHFY